jgi:Zn ribbon nucleic-acid-binding protein
MPVVTLGVDQVAKHAIMDQLPHRLDLRIPPQDEARDGLYVGASNGVANRECVLQGQADRLFDDNMPPSFRRTHAVLAAQVSVRA